MNQPDTKAQADALRSAFAEQIVAARSRAGMSREAAARNMGAPPISLYNMEFKTKPSRILSLARYAVAVGQPIACIGYKPGDVINFGANCRRHREAIKLGVRDAAKMVFGADGMHPNLAAIESGGDTAVEHAIRMAHALGITLPELLFGQPQETP